MAQRYEFVALISPTRDQHKVGNIFVSEIK
jgi:hypothetical protein